MFNPSKSWDPHIAPVQLHGKMHCSIAKKSNLMEIPFFICISYRISEGIKFLNHVNTYPNPISSHTHFFSIQKLFEATHLPNPQNSF